MMNDKEFEELILKCYRGRTVAILGYQEHEGRQRAGFLKKTWNRCRYWPSTRR